MTPLTVTSFACSPYRKNIKELDLSSRKEQSLFLHKSKRLQTRDKRRRRDKKGGKDEGGGGGSYQKVTKPR